MGISKPSQGWAKHQKDMAVLSFHGCPVFPTLALAGGFVERSALASGSEPGIVLKLVAEATS